MTSDLRGEAGWCGGRSTSGGGFWDLWVREPASGVRRRGGHDRLPAGGWEVDQTPALLRTAPRVAVKLAGALYPVVGQSFPTGRRLVRLEPKTPDCEAGPEVPLLAGLPAGPMVPPRRSLPERGEGPLRREAGRAGQGFRSPKNPPDERSCRAVTPNCWTSP